MEKEKKWRIQRKWDWKRRRGKKRKLARVNVSSIDEPGGSHYIRLALTTAVPAVAAWERKDSAAWKIQKREKNVLRRSCWIGFSRSDLGRWTTAKNVANPKNVPSPRKETRVEAHSISKEDSSWLVAGHRPFIERASCVYVCGFLPCQLTK